MSPQMINHIAFSSETLATLLGAFEGSRIVMHSHMNLQYVPIVELFSTAFNRAVYVLSLTVIRHMSLEILSLFESPCAAFEVTSK